MALSTSFPLITAARAYAARGWSVIPLHEKRAAVAWKSYQGRHANDAEQHEWFGGAGGVSGIGIVTGRISSLAVLDLDGEDAISLFTEIAPHLLDTCQVKTRRGIHLYYEVPARLMLTNIQTTGFSLQWEGRYVVAPPSRVGETTYTLRDAHAPRLLTAEDAAIFLRLRFAWAALHPPTQAIYAETGVSEFCPENAPNQILCSSPYKSSFNCQETLTIEVTAVNEDKSPIPNDNFNLPHTASIEKQAQTFYLALTETVGRNHALFRTACWLRDHHVAHPRAADILTTLHIDQKPGSPCTEKPDQRRREAVRTLASAYRRPPGSRDGGGRGLDDRVRQALISTRNGGNAAARALDALMLLNVPLGTVLSREQLHHLVGESVKRDGLDKALRIVLPNGCLLFERVTPQSVPPPDPPPSNADLEKGKTNENNAIVGVQIAGSIPIVMRGRPHICYRLPTLSELRNAFALHKGKSSPLSNEALKRPRAYREAVLHGFITRRPGSYTVGWLAGLVSVSRRTVQTYLARLRERGLCRAPTYTAKTLDWSSLPMVDEIRETQGKRRNTHIQDTGGRNYPLNSGLARTLLKAGRKLKLLTRLSDVFWVERADSANLPNMPMRFHDPTPRAMQAVGEWGKWQPVEHTTTETGIQYLYETDPAPRPVQHTPAARMVDDPPLHIPLPGVDMPRRSRTRISTSRSPNFRRRLKDGGQESLAQWLKTQINGVVAGEEQGSQAVSIRTTRAWTHFFGSAAVKSAMGTFSALMKKDYAFNRPVGWFDVVVRSRASAEARQAWWAWRKGQQRIAAPNRSSAASTTAG